MKNPSDSTRKDVRFTEAHSGGFNRREFYGPYVNEELVGEVLAPVRDKVAIATKFGFKIDGTNGLGSRPERIRKVVEAGTKQLVRVGFVGQGDEDDLREIDLAISDERGDGHGVADVSEE